MSITGEWIDKMWYVISLQCNSPMTSKLLTHAAQKMTLSERKQPDSKYYILCDSICVRFLEKAEGGSQSAVAFARGRTEDCLQKGTREILGCCKYSKIDGDGVCAC